MTMNRKEWKKYIDSTVKSKYESGDRVADINMAALPWNGIFKSFISTYCDDDVRDDYLRKDSNIRFRDAISPAKIFNPFILVSNIAGLATVMLAKGIDSIFPSNKEDKLASHPIAKWVKKIGLYPLRVLSTGLAPVAAIHRLPVINRIDQEINKKIYGHEMSPLGQKCSTAKTTSEMSKMQNFKMPTLEQPVVSVVQTPQEAHSGVKGILAKAGSLFKRKQRSEVDAEVIEPSSKRQRI